jgi:hypothetical protein
MVQAHHVRETDGLIEAMTVRATRVIEMEKHDEQWLIADMAMERDMPIDNLALFGKMQEGVAQGRKRGPVRGK